MQAPSGPPDALTGGGGGGDGQFPAGDVLSVTQDPEETERHVNVLTPEYFDYVEKLQDPTREELERDAQMEAEAFGEIRNVEKLLALLSVRDGGRRGEREEEEIGELYQRTLRIRPKLIELIGRYSQKKGESFPYLYLLS